MSVPAHLIASVRRHVADFDSLIPAIQIQCTDPEAELALVHVTSSNVSSEIGGVAATAPEFDLDLTVYTELDDLINTINALDLWEAGFAPTGVRVSPNHSTSDLQAILNVNVKRTIVTLNVLHRYGDEVYTMVLEEALKEHNFQNPEKQTYTWDILPEREEFLVVWLAVMQMCLIRATEATVRGVTTQTQNENTGSYSISLGDLSISESGPGSSAYASLAEGVGTPTDWLDIYDKYKKKYADETGIGNSDKDTDHLTVDIQQAEVYRYDVAQGRRVPFHIAPRARAAVLSINYRRTDRALVDVAPNTDVDFSFYKLFKITDLDQDVLREGELLSTIYNQREEQILLTDMDPGEKFWVCLVTFNTSTKEFFQTTDANVISGMFPTLSNKLEVRAKWEAPVLTSIDPITGIAGDTITITGENLQSTNLRVFVGTRESLNVVQVDEFTVEADIPTGPITGTVADIKVRDEDDQEATLVAAYTYL